MGFTKNISKGPILDERINQLLRQKKDENVALKKLLNALERARQMDSVKPKKN
jgi:hypothetical protein